MPCECGNFTGLDPLIEPERCHHAGCCDGAVGPFIDYLG